MGPRSCYDEGKRIAETLCYEYGKFSINKIKLARIFNTYGPYMSKDDGRVVSNLINQALENKDLTINGDGKQTRSFCYIDDLVKGIISLANYKENLVTPINLGNPFEFTILELAEIITKKINNQLKIVFNKMPENDPIMRKPDITKSFELLNWKPVIQLSEGINKTIEYFKFKKHL